MPELHIGARSQSMYSNHAFYTVVDHPAEMIPPSVLCGGTYLGDVRSILRVIRYHMSVDDMARRLNVYPHDLGGWIEDGEPVVGLEPAEWWELLKMRAEVLPRYEADRRRRFRTDTGAPDESFV